MIYRTIALAIFLCVPISSAFAESEVFDRDDSDHRIPYHELENPPFDYTKVPGFEDCADWFEDQFPVRKDDCPKIAEDAETECLTQGSKKSICSYVHSATQKECDRMRLFCNRADQEKNDLYLEIE